MSNAIAIDEAAIHRACQDYGVATLKLFGSLARGNFDDETSDADFLVTFLPDRDRPFEDYMRLLEALERITGRKVDLVDEDSIRNPYFKESALASVKEVYAR